MNELAVNAHQNFTQTVTIKRGINLNFLELARLLKENKDNKYYQTLGYDTFESYIALPELSLNRSNVYKLINIYETFVIKHNVAPARLCEVEWTKLATIIPRVTAENVEDMVAKAESLSRSDLRAEVSEKEGTEYIVCPRCHGSGKIKREDI